MSGSIPVLADADRLVRRGAGWLDRRARVVFGVMAAIAFLGLLYLGRHGSFFQDEWAFIRIGGWGTLADWFAPHNEHWSTVPFALYRLLLNTVGLRTYLPYLAVLLGAHVLAASAVFVLLRRTSGALIALVGGGLFLVLGSGYQNLFWAFQIGFVGSTAAGLWAMVAIDGRRPALAMIALLLAVACSTMGLAFLAAGGAMLAVDRRRWREAIWLVPVAVAFLVWLVLIGREGLGGQHSSLSAANVLDIPRFVLLGAVAAIEATFGVRGLPGRLLAGLLAAAAAILVARAVVRRDQVPRLLVGSMVGFVALYVLIDLGRAQLGDAQATRSRYLYEGAALLLVACGTLTGRRLDPMAGREPTAGAGAESPRGAASRAVRPAFASVLLAVLVVALCAGGLIANVAALRSGARFFVEGAGELRATIDAVEAFGSALPYDPPPPTRWSIPSPADLSLAIQRWGSPRRDVIVPSAVRPPTARERDRALWRLVGGATRPVPIATPADAPTDAEILAGRPITAPADGPNPVNVTDPAGAQLIRVGACTVLYAGDHASGAMTPVISLPDGGSVDVWVDAGGQARCASAGSGRPTIST